MKRKILWIGIGSSAFFIIAFAVAQDFKPKMGSGINRPLMIPTVPTKFIDLDERFQQQRTYKGTSVTSLNPQDELFRQVSTAFQAQDPRPEERLHEFAFCAERGDMAIVGWKGNVRSVFRGDSGKLAIELEVRPSVVSRRGGYVSIPFTTIEFWELEESNLKLVKVLPGKGLKAIFVD